MGSGVPPHAHKGGSLPPEGAPADLGRSGAGSIPDCQSCGGCCAWSETWPVLMGSRDGEGIPEDLIDMDNERMQSYGHRCAALDGKIGRQVGCSVYAVRPLVCREFKAGSDDCLMVRRELGLDRA